LRPALATAAAGLVALALAACTDDPAPSTTVTALSQPSAPDITFPPLDPDLVFGMDRYAGYLPDGTDYVVYLETPNHEAVTSIEADVMFEDPSGGVWLIGPVDFRGRDAGDGIGLVDGDYRVPIGEDWTAVIELSPEVLDVLGDDPEAALEAGISGSELTVGGNGPGFPGLELAPPFRWATANDPTGPMEVWYETFSVRPGCDPDAAACTWTGFLQVYPRQGFASAVAEIDSLRLRPESDPNYLDPGPYGTRQGADVLWSGDEMIVWGGRTPDGEWAPGGAAFNPATDVWRVFEGPGVPELMPSRAAWTDRGMVVVTAGGTYLGDVATDSWEKIADGVEPPESPHQILGVGSDVYIWAGGGIIRLAPSGWEELRGLEVSTGRSWALALRDWDGRLLVSLLPGDRCEGHDYYVWTDDSWERLPEVSLASGDWADCSLASQVAVVDAGPLAWDDDQHATMLFDEASGGWATIETIPMPGWDSPPGGLVMGDRLLVPSGGSGAVYDPGSGEWERVTLPGNGYDTQLVWTGKEVLAFGAARNDAWRWSPPG
jgi:hypothetical protein